MIDIDEFLNRMYGE